MLREPPYGTMNRANDSAPERSLDQDEVHRFSQRAEAWWDPDGDFAALHRINPLRLAFIREHCLRHFGGSESGLTGLSALDVGCGGGILSEPLARMGAAVTAIDPSDASIEAAKAHARAGGLTIDYQALTAEALAAEGRRFDVVLAMEVLEHVADVPAFLRTCARLTKPGGLFFCATLNRTLKSYALAILGAEYVLRWVPVGTHDWNKFITPDELRSGLSGAGLALAAMEGIVFDPLAGSWRRSADTDVNYMALAEVPAESEGGGAESPSGP